MLHFNGLEPVDFKGKMCEPKVDTEARLRLNTIKFGTDAEIREADEVLASCFNEQYAKDFIRNKLSPDDKEILRTYLVSGETGLNRLNDITSGAISRFIKREMENEDV